MICAMTEFCHKLLKGQPSEWALTRRHESEEIFGIQVCGGKPEVMVKVAELLNNEVDVDFVDINVCHWH